MEPIDYYNQLLFNPTYFHSPQQILLADKTNSLSLIVDWRPPPIKYKLIYIIQQPVANFSYYMIDSDLKLVSSIYGNEQDVLAKYRLRKKLGETKRP